MLDSFRVNLAADFVAGPESAKHIQLDCKPWRRIFEGKQPPDEEIDAGFGETS